MVISYKIYLDIENSIGYNISKCSMRVGVCKRTLGRIQQL